MTDKQRVVELLDSLGPGQLAAVAHILESLIAENRDTLSIPHERAFAEFGLTPADWEKMAGEKH